MSSRQKVLGGVALVLAAASLLMLNIPIDSNEIGAQKAAATGQPNTELAEPGCYTEILDPMSALRLYVTCDVTQDSARVLGRELVRLEESRPAVEVVSVVPDQVAQGTRIGYFVLLRRRDAP